MLDEMGIPSAILPDYDDGVTEMVHTPADVTPQNNNTMVATSKHHDE